MFTNKGPLTIFIHYFFIKNPESTQPGCFCLLIKPRLSLQSTFVKSHPSFNCYLPPLLGTCKAVAMLVTQQEAGVGLREEGESNALGKCCEMPAGESHNDVEQGNFGRQ
jgi:hypothetical protein